MVKIEELKKENPLLLQKDACAAYGVPESSYSKWRSKYRHKWGTMVEEASRGDKGRMQGHTRFGSGRSALYPLLEERLYQACVDRRECGDKVCFVLHTRVLSLGMQLSE